MRKRLCSTAQSHYHHYGIIFFPVGLFSPTCRRYLYHSRFFLVGHKKFFFNQVYSPQFNFPAFPLLPRHLLGQRASFSLSFFVRGLLVSARVDMLRSRVCSPVFDADLNPMHFYSFSFPIVNTSPACNLKRTLILSGHTHILAQLCLKFRLR